MATCPRCGAQATGNFCSNCGASLAVEACPNCGKAPEVGARFCNHCGFGLVLPGAATGKGAGPVAGGMAGTGRGGGASRAAPVTADAAAASDKKMIIGLAAVFAVGIALIVLLPIFKRETTDAVPGGDAVQAPFAGGAGGGTGAPPDLSQMTPRQAADRLFERVMAAADSGDQATAQQFMPMALQAYDMARPLDLDGLYHLAMLNATNNDHATALKVAREGLDTYPDHLLLLGVAASEAAATGDAGAAKQYRAHFLEVYDDEIAKKLEEYEGHQQMIAQYRQEAASSKP